MSHDDEFKSLPASAQASLRQLADAVGGVVPSRTNVWTLRTSDLKPGSADPTIVSEVKTWAGTDSAFLYYFMLTNEVALATAERAYSDAKAREKNERAYARLIKVSRCFYVGGSQNIPQRLKEHLGFGAKKTYALQLAYWAPPLKIELKFVCAQYSSHVNEDVLQALEDALWDRLTPMFGRRGRR